MNEHEQKLAERVAQIKKELENGLLEPNQELRSLLVTLLMSAIDEKTSWEIFTLIKTYCPLRVTTDKTWLD